MGGEENMDVREMQGDARMARRKRELIGVRVHGDRRGTYRRREGKKCYKTVGNLTMGGPRPARKRTMYNATNRNPTSEGMWPRRHAMWQAACERSRSRVHAPRSVDLEQLNLELER